MATMDLYKALKDKRILFVDDRPEVIRSYITKVDEFQAKVDSCTKISNACSALVNRNYEFVVLDLNMILPDPLPSVITEEIGTMFQISSASLTKEKRILNSGQILGMFINKRWNRRLPFIYLSAVGIHYEQLSGGEPIGERPCYDKFETSPKQLVEIIADIISPHPE